MYMTVKADIQGFDWDRGNSEKSFNKHGVSQTEAEELFVDEKLIIHKDLRHSQNEQRFLAIGKTVKGKLLFAVLTYRNQKIRIISIRSANKKDKETYEKT